MNIQNLKLCFGTKDKQPRKVKLNKSFIPTVFNNVVTKSKLRSNVNNLRQSKGRDESFFSRRKKLTSSVKKRNFNIRVVSPNVRDEEIEKPHQRLFSPPARAPKLSWTSEDLTQQSIQLEGMLHKLDIKVMLARHSRFTGLASPSILKRKSRQFMSIERDRSSCMPIFHSDKKTPVYDSLKNIELQRSTLRHSRA